MYIVHTYIYVYLRILPVVCWNTRTTTSTQPPFPLNDEEYSEYDTTYILCNRVTHTLNCTNYVYNNIKYIYNIIGT